MDEVDWCPYTQQHARRQSLCRLEQRPEESCLTKAGYLHKRAKVTRTWLRRWCAVSSTGDMTSSNRPSQVQDCAEQVFLGKIAGAVSKLKTHIRGTQKVYGFKVLDASGNRKSFYCDTAAQRDSWVWFLSRVAKTQVFLGDRYHVDWQHVVGSGAYADVLQGWDRQTGEAIALKVVGRLACTRYADLMHREAEMMHLVEGHPHIANLREVFMSPQHIYLVTDFLWGGDLHDCVLPRRTKLAAAAPLSEANASQVIRQLLSALAHLHDRRIAHMDVKPENVMLASRDTMESIRLIDFNSAVYFDEPSEPGGTPEYMAPELICTSSHRCWGGETDIWAVGILLFWLLSCSTPFWADSIPGILSNIENGRWGFHGTHWRGVSDEAKDLIRSFIRRRPDMRPTARQLLNHPWVTGACISEPPADPAAARWSLGSLPLPFESGALAPLAGIPLPRGLRKKDTAACQALNMLADASTSTSPCIGKFVPSPRENSGQLSTCGLQSCTQVSPMSTDDAASTIGSPSAAFPISPLPTWLHVRTCNQPAGLDYGFAASVAVQPPAPCGLCGLPDTVRTHTPSSCRGEDLAAGESCGFSLESVMQDQGSLLDSSTSCDESSNSPHSCTMVAGSEVDQCAASVRKMSGWHLGDQEESISDASECDAYTAGCKQ